MSIEKVGHLIETIKTSVEENGIDPFCEVTVRLGATGREIPISCLAVKRTVTGLRLIVQTEPLQ